MGASLTRIYGLEGGRRESGVECLILRFDGRGQGRRQGPAISAPINIGFLSNITFDNMGFVEFFGVLRRLKQLGVDVPGDISPALSRRRRVPPSTDC